MRLKVGATRHKTEERIFYPSYGGKQHVDAKYAWAFVNSWRLLWDPRGEYLKSNSFKNRFGEIFQFTM